MYKKREYNWPAALSLFGTVVFVVMGVITFNVDLLGTIHMLAIVGFPIAALIVTLFFIKDKGWLFRVMYTEEAFQKNGKDYIKKTWLEENGQQIIYYRDLETGDLIKELP